MPARNLINGAHAIIYSKNPEADRAFLRDVLGFSHIDIGGGWLIFSLPASELAVHPSRRNDVHELYFMCPDIRAFVAVMNEKGVRCGPVRAQTWGKLIHLTLPGGGKLGVYEPLHASPAARQRRTRASGRSTVKRTSKG